MIIYRILCMAEINEIATKQIEKIRQDCEKIKPLVAIRSITYNHEPYIRDALEGFVMQKTNFPFVAIVHDDASTDGTASIIHEYAEKYPDIILPIYETENQYSKKNGSVTRIMNEAGKKTGAQYIAICEGDDYWTDPLKLQKQVDFLESHPDYGMCYTKVQRYNQKEKKITEVWGGPNETFEDLLLRNTVPTLTTMFRTDLYRIYLQTIHPENKNWNMGDYPIWLFISLNSRVSFMPEITGVYRELPESASHTKLIDKKYKFNKCYKSIAEYFLTKYGDRVNFDTANKFYESKHSLLMGMAHITRDNHELYEAREFFKKKKKSFRTSLLLLPNWIMYYPLKLKLLFAGWHF